jgi:DNA-binding LacI/PurR family transcriptional regulator
MGKRLRKEVKKIKQVLLKDLARAAGVSEATASRALSGSGRISEETRERVRKLAEAMGYSANPLARGLAGGRTNLIGVCGAGVLKPFMHRLLSQLANYAASQGQKLVFAPLSLEEGLRVLLPLQIDGLIICWQKLSEKLAEELLQQRNLPTVVLGTHSKYCSSFNVDRRGGVKAGISKLIELGHRKIAFIGEGTASSKWQGFKDAYEEAGFEVSEEVIISCQGSTLGGYSAVDKFLEAGYTAAFTTNDEIAVGLIRALEERNFHVPEDYSVLGYDGIYLDQLGRPRLATLAQPSLTLAKRAIEQLLAGPGELVHESILPELIIGDSIGKRG